MVTHLEDWQQWIQPKPLSERLWEKTKPGAIPVDKPDLGACIIWTGTKLNVYRGERGYGQLSIRQGSNRLRPRKILAHRLAYELTVGRIPDGMDLDHLCNNTLCVNPAHLEPVSRRENFARANGNIYKTHCPKGHPYTDPNTYQHPGAYGFQRVCRICRRDSGRRSDAKRRGKS